MIMMILGEFNTLEGFFSFYCFLKRPSEVEIDNKLMMFRKGCMPLWEVFNYLLIRNKGFLRIGKKEAVGFYKSRKKNWRY